MEQDPTACAQAIAASGYVPSHAEAISRVAMDEDVVILGRPVNRNATALIAAHNATKDMLKGKSSSWGPQKRYLPVEQRFSKLHFAKENREDEIDDFDGKVRELQRAKDDPFSVVVQKWKENAMFTIHEGQCGVCTHFGEHHPQEEHLVQIHNKHEAPEDFVDECGHPQHAALHLKVTAISGCDAFEPVPEDASS